MSDLATRSTPDGLDWALAAPGLAEESGLDTAIHLSLFTDARAEEELPADQDPGGWWGDAFADIEGDEIGSRLWLLRRGPLTDKTVVRARAYALEALQWLLDDGVASRLEVRASRLGRETLVLEVDLAPGWQPVQPAILTALGGVMAWDRPTLQALVDRIAADLEGKLTGVSARLRRSNVKVLSRVLAGAVHGLYGFLAWLARQLLPDRAQDEYLDRWGAIWIGAKQPAEPAVGTATFTGTNGSEVEAGQLLQRLDGVQLRVTAPATVAGGEVQLSLEAVLPGASGNTPSGEALTFVTPVSGVDATGAVDAGGLQGGLDEEDAEVYRTRLLERIREPAQGGAEHDFVAWAKTVPGVTRAWAYPNWMGLGTVGVTFVLDGEEDIIPNQTKVDEVAAAIEAERTITSEVWVFAPRVRLLNPDLDLDPDTAEVRAAVIAELQDLLKRESVPGGYIPFSHFSEAVSAAAGEFDHILHTPSTYVLLDPGEILLLGEVTFH